MQRLRVMVVDDQEANGQIAREFLEAEGHHVVLVANGLEALEHLERNAAPDVLVCDLVMPKVDGLELLKRLRQDVRFATLPVVMCSGHPHLAERVFPFKSVSALKKPFHFRALVDAVVGHVMREARAVD